MVKKYVKISVLLCVCALLAVGMFSLQSSSEIRVESSKLTPNARPPSRSLEPRVESAKLTPNERPPSRSLEPIESTVHAHPPDHAGPNVVCNCNTSEKQTSGTGINILKQNPSFKIQGVVFNCITRKPLKTYDADVVDKIAKPVTITGQQAEDPDARKLSFIDIFQKQTWGGKEESLGETNRLSENFKASGPGSNLVNTQGPMALLHSVIEKLKVSLKKEVISIADIPCGDMQWISHFLKTRGDVQYTGIDIVPELIKRHRTTYRNNKLVNFINMDVVHSPLNQSFDIIFSRQMMQHFLNLDIQRVLYHFSSSGSKYMIATTYSDQNTNTELPGTTSYRFRTINLELSPFNLVPPTCTFQETQQTDNYLGMWELPLKSKN